MNRNIRPVIAIHGGSGTIPRGSLTPELEADYRRVLAEAAGAGEAILRRGGSALDAVAIATLVMEDSPLFNAGKGSVLTSEGRVEMDAAIMDGNGTRAGAVAGLRSIRNPILAARAVMEKSRHVMFTGEGAEAFAIRQGLATMPAGYFIVPRRVQQLEDAKNRQSLDLDHTAPDPDSKFGTVGAVALDAKGNLAAATTTGGMTNKLPGRIGDSPVIGAGTYAENDVVAVSATGSGEMFMRAVGAYDIAAQMKYGKALPKPAMDAVLARIGAMGGRGGFIAVDAGGGVTFGFNTDGMYRAYAKSGEAPVTRIFKDE